jgi:GntR family transcriptional regulator/MocR family aminotransferase
MTTTPSTATTGGPSGHCKRSTPPVSHTSAPPARHSAPRCGSAGSSLPANWHTAIARLRPGTDLGTSIPEQLTLAQLISSGALQRHLRRTRARYRDRRAALAAAIARHLPGARIEGIAARLHLVARLPRHLDERQILHDARQRGIRLYGLTDYEISHRSPTPGLVLGYAGLTTQAINDGIAELAALIT